MKIQYFKAKLIHIIASYQNWAICLNKVLIRLNYQQRKCNEVISKILLFIERDLI